VSAEKGNVDLAEQALHHASLLDIHSTDALNLIAFMRMGENRFDDARRAQQRAVARQPDQPRQYVLLSNILEKMGRSGEARQALAKVDQLRTLANADKAAN
jgi:Flp pilus assembly protein TadD